MARYAQGTTVSTDKSRGEIEKLVRRHGATAFGSEWSGKSARVMFEVKGRHLRFELPMPDARLYGSSGAKYDAEERRRWRCLLLAIKAKFEAVENGIAMFDEEFLPNIVIPTTGETIAQTVVPQIRAAYERGAQLGLLLPPAGAT